MKILVDMNLSPAWIPWLESAGLRARHWRDVGRGDATDAEIFEWARCNSYVIFTHDLDFGAMLAHCGSRSPSVFQVRTQDVTPARLGSRVIGLMHRFERELCDGALIVVDELRDRVRLLPLHRLD